MQVELYSNAIVYLIWQGLVCKSLRSCTQNPRTKRPLSYGYCSGHRLVNGTRGSIIYNLCMYSRPCSKINAQELMKNPEGSSEPQHKVCPTHLSRKPLTVVFSKSKVMRIR